MSLTDAVMFGDSSTPRRLIPTPTAEDGERGRNGAGTDRLGAATFGGGVRLLPTPQAADGDGGRLETGAMGSGGVRPSGQKATLPLPTAVAMREEISATPFAEVGEQASLFEAAEVAVPLLPTPVANPDNPGSGGELRTALVHGEGRRNETGIDTLGRPNDGRPSRLMPTPTTQDAHNNGSESQRGRHSDPLNVVAADLADPLQLLPTPRVTSERNSRHAMVENQQWSSVSLAQATEIAQGILPREFHSWDEVPGELGRDARARIAAAQLLPTPQAADGERTSEQGPRHYIAGEDNPTLLGAARRVSERLLPTPTGTEDGRKSDEAMRARGEGGQGSPPGLGQTVRERVGAEINWGVYEGAVRRWETIFGEDAPAPTDEKGRLAPEFVNWMMGFPEGWHDVEGVSRTRKLRCLGNAVVVHCGELVGEWLAFLVEEGMI